MTRPERLFGLFTLLVPVVGCAPAAPPDSAVVAPTEVVATVTPRSTAAASRRVRGPVNDGDPTASALAVARGWLRLVFDAP